MFFYLQSWVKYHITRCLYAKLQMLQMFLIIYRKGQGGKLIVSGTRAFLSRQPQGNLYKGICTIRCAIFIQNCTSYRAILYICPLKLRKECNLLEMSVGQMLMIVIGYDLVSYLLHYSSARCVTFKELFICKSNNKTGDFDMNLPDFFYLIQIFP